MSDPNLPEGVTQQDIDRSFVSGEPPEDVVYGIDGDQHTCVRGDFENLQESLCGFGNTEEDALEDLIRQEKESGGR